MALPQQVQQAQQPAQPTRWTRVREFLAANWISALALMLVVALVVVSGVVWGNWMSWGRSVEDRIPEPASVQKAVSSGVREGLGAVNTRLDDHEGRLKSLEAQKQVPATASPKSEEEGFVATLKEWATGMFATKADMAKVAEKAEAALAAANEAKAAKSAQIPAAPATKQIPAAPAKQAPTASTPVAPATKQATATSVPAAPAAPAKQVVSATSSGMSPTERQRLEALETQVVANTQGVAANKTAIGALDSRLGTLEEKVAEILPRLKSLSGRVVEAPPTLGGYMPAKEIGRSLGYEVQWTPERKDDAGGTIAESVFFSKGGILVAAAKFGSDNYYVSPCGMESRLFIAGRPPVKRSGIAYLPELFFEELQTRAAKCP